MTTHQWADSTFWIGSLPIGGAWRTSGPSDEYDPGLRKGKRAAYRSVLGVVRPKVGDLRCFSVEYNTKWIGIQDGETGLVMGSGLGLEKLAFPVLNFLCLKKPVLFVVGKSLLPEAGRLLRSAIDCRHASIETNRNQQTAEAPPGSIDLGWSPTLCDVGSRPVVPDPHELPADVRQSHRLQGHQL
jgi:hypothetical protein